jgi:hypothetical protein
VGCVDRRWNEVIGKGTLVTRTDFIHFLDTRILCDVATRGSFIFPRPRTTSMLTHSPPVRSQNPNTRMPSSKFPRRRPWLMIGTGSSRPASLAALVVLPVILAAASRLSVVDGRSRFLDEFRTRRNKRPSLVPSISSTDKGELLSSITAACPSLLLPSSRRPWVTLRGGQQGGGDEYGADNGNYQYPANARRDPSPSDYRTPTYPKRGDSNDEFYSPESSLPTQGYSPYTDVDGDDDNAAEMLLHETVQDRVNTWRQAQLEQSSRLQQSARDDQGRIKLLTGVSRGSRAIIFVCLVFRNLHLFEVADQALRGMLRLLVVTPLIGLFVANLAGVVASFTAPSHSTKKRLKVCAAVQCVCQHSPPNLSPPYLSRFPTGDPEP